MTQDQTPKPIHHKMEFLQGSTFSSVSLASATFTDSHLMTAKVNDCNATQMAFDDVNLSLASINNANMTGMTFTDVNMTGASISQATLTCLKISNADMTGMTIDGILVSDLLAKWNSE